MSAFHFRGELVGHDTETARYRFQTNYVDDAQRTGAFSVNLVTWAWSIDLSADSRCYADGTSRDAHCVSALIHKIRKAYGLSGLPEVVFHVA